MTLENKLRTLAAISVIGLSTLGGVGIGAFAREHNYNYYLSGHQQYYGTPESLKVDYAPGSRLDYCFKIGWGIPAFFLGLGLASAFRRENGAHSDDSDSSSERDPCKDDPGAFGPGGSRY